MTARKRLGGVMIKAGQTWRRKADGKAFVINWVSSELVAYITDGHVVPMRKFKFLQDFEEVTNG